MKIKKTFYNWLTNRFLLIIRNEENFAEKKTFSFNYAKLIVFGISFLVLVFSLCFYLINTVLFSWMNVEYQEIETNKKMVYLSSQVDSLNDELGKRAIFEENLHQILMGNVADLSKLDQNSDRKPGKVKKVNLDSIAAVDEQIRKEIESNSEIDLKNQQIAWKGNSNYFISPVEGVLSGKEKLGLKIKAVAGNIVKSVSDGVVIWSNNSDEQNSIGVQHKNGFVSIYKGSHRLLKKTGEFVKGGEGLAIVGLSNQKSENYVYFELWKDGYAANPENYISFK